MPLARASAAIAGTSWTSKLCEPGVSMKIALVFGRIKLSSEAPARGS